MDKWYVELTDVMDKTMPRLIQFHTFLGDFSIFGDVSGVGRAMALIGQFTLFESRAIIKEYRFLKKILGTGIATFQVAAFQQRSFYYMLDNKQRK